MLGPPIHPGEVLADELTQVKITPTELARQINVPANRMSQVIADKRDITVDTGPRLGHRFTKSADFWMNLQSAHELRRAE